MLTTNDGMMAVKWNPKHLKFIDDVLAPNYYMVPIDKEPVSWFQSHYTGKSKVDCKPACLLCESKTSPASWKTVKEVVSGYDEYKKTNETYLELKKRLADFQARAAVLVAPWVDSISDPFYVGDKKAPHFFLRVYGALSASAELALLALAVEFDCVFSRTNHGDATDVSFSTKPQG